MYIGREILKENECFKELCSQRKPRNSASNSSANSRSDNENNSHTMQEFLGACVELCTRNGRPFMLMDDSGFQKIVKIVSDMLIDGDKININRKTVAERVRAAAAGMRDKLRKELHNRMVSVKIDGVTRHGRCVMGLNIQFMEAKKIHIRTLGMVSLTEKHTSRLIILFRKFINYDFLYFFCRRILKYHD